MSNQHQLDIEKTFESQKDLVVQTIIPILMKTLDLITYLVGEGMIYDIIHWRHHHQRDNNWNKKKLDIERKKEAERKHKNSRRLEVNTNILYLDYYLFTSFIK